MDMIVRIPRRCLILLVLAVVLPATSYADSNTSTGDVRCLLAAVGMMNSPSNTIRAAAATSALYYLGRLDGREPGVDLEKLLLEESHRMSADDLTSESRRCGQELSARARVISSIGQRLEK